MTIDPAEIARKKRRHRNERILAALAVLLAAAVTIGVLRFRRGEDEAIARDTRYVPKKDMITPEVNLLGEFVRIDTTQPPGIGEGARWIARQLQARGVRAEIIESTPGHLNVYARIKGRRPGGALLLINHIDVVAPGSGWTQPPFAGKVVFNELYGRGALDMKAIAICQLLAFANVARSGRAPEHDLVFLATAEEERGSHNGLLWLLEHRPDLFEGVELGLTEGGLAEVMSEKMTYFGIEVAGKQTVTVRLEADSLESLRRARFRLQRYIRHRQPDRVLPVVRQYFRDVAPTRLTTRPLLADIDGTIARGKFWQLPYTYREFAQDTLRVMAPHNEGGTWVMRVVMFNLPDADPEARIAWLRSVAEKEGARIGAVLSKQGPVPATTSDTEFFRILARQAREQYQVHAGTQVLYQSLTDCRFLRTRGVACYGVSPFPVSIFQAKSIHRKDERIRLDWFAEGITYVDRVVKAWAYGPAH
jgi:acetylornithine deacetylase/succinyl-diaminopimelate desuccinylase-like protein